VPSTARTLSALLLLGGALHAPSGAAEVKVAGEGGFVSVHRLQIAAEPERVWTALTEEIARWWDAAHSYSGRAGNFYLEAEPLGCFCERLPDGSVVHMQVVFIDAASRTLRLAGGLGPLQQMGATGAMTFKLSADDAGTVLDYQYVVQGFAPGGMAALSEPVDRVQLGQLERLKAYAEG